ncbi:MAG: amino acid decarboxylase [Acidobacteriota bacterium]|nr:MAG: amino acid decarboxylase [Acidobacteriota bacterium]
MKDKTGPSDLGDMSTEEFRRHGHEIIDWIADYLGEMERFPVLSRNQPGDLKRELPRTPPLDGESMPAILADFRDLIIPGITHWNHPAFFSYFSITGSGPGILGELLCSALNVNAMLWKTSPAATELEEVTLDWLRQMLGLPDSFWGIIYDTASVSTLHALVAARECVAGLSPRQKGLDGKGGRLALYQSEHAHSSVEKAAITVGIGQEAVRKIASDAAFRMDPKALESAIQKDISAGWRPFCVVATVGTTSTTSVDPLPEIAAVCRKYHLWLHVDAAYAGPAAILPEMKWVLEGADQADSIVTNPHKWLFTPIDLSVFYCQRPDVLRRAFSLVPEYLKTNVDDTVTNYMDYGIQLGRRFRALKLWMILRYFGQKGIEARIRRQIGWAQELAEWLDSDPEFERMAPTPFSTLCFRAKPKALAADEKALEQLNGELLERVNDSGEAFLSHTKLNDRFTLRLAIGNIKTERRHLDRAVEILRQALAELKEERGI